MIWHQPVTELVWAVVKNAYPQNLNIGYCYCYYYWLVLLRFSKSRKRTVSDGFVKKSADSDSVSDSRRRHYKLIYTGHRAQRLSTGGRQMQRRCTSQVIVLASGTDATLPQADALCTREQCKGHNHLGQSPERPGHIGQPAATGRRRTLSLIHISEPTRPY